MGNWEKQGKFLLKVKSTKFSLPKEKQPEHATANTTYNSTLTSLSSLHLVKHSE